MTIPPGWRSVCCFSLFALCLSGCGQGDGGEYRAYNPATDEGPTAPPAAPVVGAADVPAASIADKPSADPPFADGSAGGSDRSDAPPTASSQSANDSSSASSPSDADSVAAADSSTGVTITPAGTNTNPPVAAPTIPREIKLLIPEKSFQKVGPENAYRMTFDDIDLLKSINMDPVTPDAEAHMPAWLTELDGKRIRIRGYMRPGELSEDLPFFLLVRDTSCCFGPLPKPYDIIPVVMREGITTDYVYLRPIDVVGEFDIAVEMDLDDETRVQFLYILRDAVVIEK